jgi:hypothetical protein
MGEDTLFDPQAKVAVSMVSSSHRRDLALPKEESPIWRLYTDATLETLGVSILEDFRHREILIEWAFLRFFGGCRGRGGFPFCLGRRNLKRLR